MTPLMIFIAVVVARIVFDVCAHFIGNAVSTGFGKLRINKGEGLIANNFIDSKQLFVKLNKELPNVLLIQGVDVNEAVKLLKENLNHHIHAVYRHNQYDFAEQEALFNMMVIVTSNDSIIEIGNGYVELLYTTDNTAWVHDLARQLAAFQLYAPVHTATSAVCVTGFAGRQAERHENELVTAG